MLKKKEKSSRENQIITKMDVDEVLHLIGDFSRSKILILGAVGIMSCMLPSWIILGITFLAAFPDHFCTVPEGARVEEYIPVVEINGEYVYSSCMQYINPGGFDNQTGHCSNGWTFSKTPYGSTIVSQWNLVCDRTQLAALAQSVLVLGMMFGAVTLGHVSDRIGRKPVLMLSLFSQGCLGMLLAFSPSFWFFSVVRFMMGIIVQGCVIPGYVLVSEFFSPKRRAIGFNLCGIFWPIGLMLLSLGAFSIRNWRYLQLAMALPYFVLTIICWFVPESPRWLVSVGRLQEANTILTKLARFSGHEVDLLKIKNKHESAIGIDNKSFVDNEIAQPSKNDQQEMMEGSSNTMTISEQIDELESKEKKLENTENHTKSTSNKHFTFLYLCKTPRMFLVTAVLATTWLASSFAYGGLSLNSVRLAGNPYLNLFMIGAIEIPANIAATTLSVRFGRRKPLCILLITSSVVCMVTGFIPRKSGSGLDLTAVIVTFAVAGKFFVTASNLIVVLYATEIFPTVVRNKGFAVGSTTARIGPLLAPFVVLLDDVHPFLPMLTFGVASAIPSFFVLLLPETQGKSQPETEEDVELMYREQKLRSKVNFASRDDNGVP